MLFRIMLWRSTGVPGRRAGKQATVGKADAVDQDHPEDEADQARRHAEPPIEFRQIDRREHKRRRQDQRDQHHSDDRAEPEQQQIAECCDRFADDGQDHQGDGGRSCKAVHDADREGSQPHIERDPAEPTAVEPRQRRVLVGVPVRAGAVTVRVPVHVVAVRMRVIVEVERMSAGAARMGVGRADRAAHPVKVRMPSRTSMMPTANSIDRPSFGGMTTPNTMIAAPTAMTVMVCPTPQAAPISAEPTMLRSRLTIVAIATTWSASVACLIPRKKPRNRKDTTLRAVPVIALAPRWLSPAIVCSVSTQRQFPYAPAPPPQRPLMLGPLLCRGF